MFGEEETAYFPGASSIFGVFCHMLVVVFLPENLATQVCHIGHHDPGVSFAFSNHEEEFLDGLFDVQ